MDASLPESSQRENIVLIVPAFNEEVNVPLFVSAAERELACYEWQVLFVNDGSTDDTWRAICEQHERNARVHGLCFTRNFGHQQALAAGMETAVKDYPADVYVTMDADLQHPLAFIHEMMAEYRRGAHIVQALRQDAGRRISLMKKCTSALFYSVFSWLSGIEMNAGQSDFRLVDAQTLAFITRCREKDLFLRGLLPWSGLKMVTLPYTPAERLHGVSKFTMKKMTDLAMSGIVGYSVRPLYLTIVLGCVCLALAVLYFAYVLGMALFSSEHVSVGWPSVIATILLLGGVQLFMLGIIGIYLGRLFMDHKHRPSYVVEKSL